MQRVKEETIHTDGKGIGASVAHPLKGRQTVMWSAMIFENTLDFKLCVFIGSQWGKRLLVYKILKKANVRNIRVPVHERECSLPLLDRMDKGFCLEGHLMKHHTPLREERKIVRMENTGRGQPKDCATHAPGEDTWRQYRCIHRHN